MSKRCPPDLSRGVALELFQANPGALYSLDVAARLAGVSRRSLLVYCRVGLVRPVLQPPYGVMAFTEEAIHTVRRIEDVRAHHRIDLEGIKVIFDLLAEVDRLRAEVRFWRNH